MVSSTLRNNQALSIYSRDTRKEARLDVRERKVVIMLANRAHLRPMWVRFLITSQTHRYFQRFDPVISSPSTPLLPSESYGDCHRLLNEVSRAVLIMILPLGERRCANTTTRLVRRFAEASTTVRGWCENRLKIYRQKQLAGRTNGGL